MDFKIAPEETLFTTFDLVDVISKLAPKDEYYLAVWNGHDYHPVVGVRMGIPVAGKDKPVLVLRLAGTK